MPARFEVSVNGSAGAYVNITAKIPCRYMIVQESADVTAQGLTYQTNEAGDNFATTHQASPGAQISLGNPQGLYGNTKGALLGLPAQSDPAGNSIPATVLMKVRSVTATTSKVIVEQFE